KISPFGRNDKNGRYSKLSCRVPRGKPGFSPATGFPTARDNRRKTGRRQAEKAKAKHADKHHSL
ncbi:MAG TPA: hypothetical protein PLW56_05640, partial [Smithellaceae bacterium]|nr:hypothetical protein [Smithellaceae bacterium]HPY07930.1 hypothetical protein [Smithellaceae bacterium]HQG99974.1 hypothetical protein [Smithellaceae bacterium]HQJ77691.1 hypothetical protein [Smithellaceae bacterium]HQK91119.1 hypothetical protein [Smithellaceae bacterium]